MEKLITPIEGHDGTYEFDRFPNTVPIEIGDYYIFYFAGIWIVACCGSENEKYEINSNDRVKDDSKIDLVTGFWKNCFKIKSTNFDLTFVV